MNYLHLVKTHNIIVINITSIFGKKNFISHVPTRAQLHLSDHSTEPYNR